MNGTAKVQTTRRNPKAGVIVLLLLLCTGCGDHTAWLGGVDRKEVEVSEARTPSVVIAAMRQAHPDGRIDRIVRELSNAPVRYCIYYHDSKANGLEFTYQDWYGPFWSTGAISQGAMGRSFKRLYPDAVGDRVEWFDDKANDLRFCRVHFHVGGGAEEEVCFLEDGAVYEYLGPE